MNDAGRIRLLANEMDHQFDEDENADLVIQTDDVLVQAAVRLVNTFGGWSEIVVAPGQDLFDVIRLIRGSEDG
jgi:hypothetical protein